MILQLQVAVQHRDLRNEMQMLHPDWRVTLMLAFVALFSTRYCADRYLP